MKNKPLPSEPEAEKSVLASILNDPSCAEEVALALMPGDFYLEKHQNIMAAAYSLLSDGITPDLISLEAELRDAGHMKNGLSASYLSNLMDNQPVSTNLAHHINLLRSASARRQVIVKANELLKTAYDDSDISNIERKTAQAFQSIKFALDQNQTQGRESFSARDLVTTDFPEPKWAIPGLLVDGFTFLVGRPKQGKSMLALNIALSVACGGKALSSIDVMQGTAIYLALEDPWRRLKSRTLQMISENQAPSDLLLFNEWPRIDEGGSEQLEKEMAKHSNLRLVIIDTLQKVKGQNNNRSNAYEHDYRQVANLKTLADRAGVAMLVVHHLRKMQSADIFDQVSGSLGLTGAADSTLILDRKTGQADAVLHVTGRDVESAEYALRFDPQFLTWTLLGNADEVQSTEQRQAVYDCIKEYGHSITPKEISAATEIKERNLFKILKGLMLDGTIKKVGRGSYISLK